MALVWWGKDKIRGCKNCKCRSMLFITHKIKKKSASFHGFSNKFQIKRCGYEAQKVVAAFKFSHSLDASSKTQMLKLNQTEHKL